MDGEEWLRKQEEKGGEDDYLMLWDGGGTAADVGVRRGRAKEEARLWRR